MATHVMKFSVLFLLAFQGTAVLAGGPVAQESTARGVVRIMKGVTDNSVNGSFLGSGSVIGNKNVGGQGWLVVLTADHVVSANESANGGTIPSLGIGLGSAIAGASSGLPAGFVSRMGGQKIDLAVLGIHYGNFSPAVSNAVRSLITSDPTTKPATFTGVGYVVGLVAENSNSLWRSNGDVGQRRFANNGAYSISEEAVETFGGYKNQIVRWKSLAPSSPQAVEGQGVLGKGDSGGPYFTTGLLEETVGSNKIGTFENTIFAVHSGAQALFAADKTYLGHTYGSEQWGVYLNDTNRTWIANQVKAVPEPSSLLVLVGLCSVLRKRRR